ncbi:MAG TPA: NAD(P)/FAD-dependent oxidoreductase [Saprospiraceae bacterium]|nr:NAD(P)/FAD-dependent oxidoreductase [Saprospiraceae bacterium]
MKDIPQNKYDLIVIGAGSGGLSVGLFMAKLGLKILMIAKSAQEIGGECLNDGCVPSKALIHVSRMVHNANQASEFGLEMVGKVDIEKAIGYVHSRQELIRRHENATWLRDQGIEVELGEATFSGRNEITVNERKFCAKKIVLATGSKPRKLVVPGVELVTYFDNENIFHIDHLPDSMLVVGAGPIGIEIAQALSRLGTKITVIDEGDRILAHDDEELTTVLLQKLEAEGIEFYFNVTLQEFTSANDAELKSKTGELIKLHFGAVFVGIGRILVLEPLQLQQAGIEVKGNKIVVDKKLRTTNKDVLVCGDIAGDLQFSHAAEFHARIILNNFFSPFKKKLDNKYMSWVTFTDPELATFGMSEKEMNKRGISFRKVEQDFSTDDRAITDNYQYAKLILYVSIGGWFRKQIILGGTMIAPNAGELVQELILANSNKISLKAIFNKIYPYPTATRVNQQLVIKLKEATLTPMVKALLHKVYNFLN